MAEERPASLDAVGARGRPGGVVTCGRVLLAVEVRAEPVGGPLPDVARAVVEAVGVRLEGIDGAGGGVAVGAGVVVGEGALPDVAAVLSGRGELVAPGVDRLIEASPGGVLPLSLGGQALAGPLADTPGRR